MISLVFLKDWNGLSSFRRANATARDRVLLSFQILASNLNAIPSPTPLPSLTCLGFSMLTVTVKNTGYPPH